MTDPATGHLAIAALYALPALVWGVLAYNYAVMVRTVSPPMRLVWIFPVWGGLVTFIYLVLAVGELAQPEAGLLFHRFLFALFTLAMVAVGAVLRHLIVTLTSFLVDDKRPGRRWLAVNYGSAVLTAPLVLLPLRAPVHWVTSGAIATAYLIVMASLGARQVRARIRRGPLRMGTLATQLHRADVALFVIAGALLVGVVAVGFAGGATGGGVDAAIALVGLLAAAGPALRSLTAFLRGVVLTLATVSTAGAIYFGAHALGASLASPLARRFLDVGAVLGLALVLVPGRSWLRAAIDGVLLRHSRRIREEQQTFLRTLSPELGTVECCRRALAEVVRAWQFRGAAILLDDGTTLVEGDLAFEPLRELWPRGAAADRLPAHPFTWLWVNDLPLRRALAAADVAGVLPILSPRRRWGHLFTSIGLLGWDKSEDEVEAAEAFCDQLALVLDGAELLARTVAVERSLAHAEKLAAIGETAARIAHDIRNPVTAARSLAQQLACEPGARFRAEHEVILAELERVERQVASLLRFARREEFELAPVDLGALVQAAVEGFRPRLERAGILVDLDVADGVTLRADAEKLRQVLINLIENAADALADGATTRRLTVALASANGSAVIRVTDSGPGVPEEAMPRLFEPFFSLKPHGTGLGLAIAKRTVDAHGGRITAARAVGPGMMFAIELPLGGPA